MRPPEAVLESGRVCSGSSVALAACLAESSVGAGLDSAAVGSSESAESSCKWCIKASSEALT